MTPAKRPAIRSALWDREALRDPHRHPDKAERVRAMFDAIAPTYERVNTLATLGRDGAWRRRAVVAADVLATDIVLDVACGTGDMIRAFARARTCPARIIGVDFAPEMLARGDYTGLATVVELIEADALNLPLPDESVDVISCAFGVRNFQSVQAGLCEMYRVGRAGARVVILEFATPANPVLRRVYQFYCDALLPRLGTLIARDRVGAYRYLPKSVQTFESQQSMVHRLEDVGFRHITTRGMNFGGVVLYCGAKCV